MPNRIEKVSINLRLPRDLHEKLVEAGSSRLPPVSLNSEILRRLLKTFEPPSAVDYDKEMFRLFGEKRIRKLEGRVEELTQRMEKPIEFQEAMRVERNQMILDRIQLKAAGSFPHPTFFASRGVPIISFE